ncbi:D-alanine--D-alanine ligase [Phytohabitans sp. ZYX-F-186]|uniref:D-alanine--D-alanine ligase n=1 Tax=Phytohabitans maris TaxID=3071409 RepID=A0ABU0ZAT0_9ACTN|nr:D-alanine--D-alanine ligase [Phytohabitans sp. ZYX-F-186]MDQ7904173.1 D-alanine--D-alanine ligase [Phytohabitans sp. ZYX-F-186]
MPELGRVLVLAGGLSPEREVSLHSGRRVFDALRRLDVDVEFGDLGPDLMETLIADPPSVVLPVLHGNPGEDGTVREVLELVGVPYVGASAEACRLAFDKPLAKALLVQAGLGTPASVTLPREAFHDLGAAPLISLVLKRLGLPLFVKPRAGGSAFGVSRVNDADQLPAALMACFAYHDTALIERAVVGVEVAVAVVDLGDGPVATPAVEIVPRRGIYDYAAHYTAGATEFFCPARLSDPAAAAVAEAALTAHRALGLRDLSRTDLIVDKDDRVFVLETAVAPGLTETSTFLMGLAAKGYAFERVWLQLARLAEARGSSAAVRRS